MLTLIDASCVIYRHYYAGSNMVRESDQHPIGAVSGICNMFWRQVNQPHEFLAMVYDVGRSTFRTDAYPDYKAHRDPAPEGLTSQFPLIRDATDAFNIPRVECPHYEADDVIATCTRQAVEAGHEVTIISSDKDLMQLIRPGVSMLNPANYQLIGVDEVVAKFGVEPSQVADLLAIMGDESDNIPGIPGIGVKGAAKLLNEYGDLETILDPTTLSHMKPSKQLEKLYASGWLARISKKLTVLKDDAPIGVNFTDYAFNGFDRDKIVEFLQRQELVTLTAEIEAGALALA